MGEWKEYKLGEIIKIVGGGTPKTSECRYWNGNIPWLSVVDFNNDRKYVYETEKHISVEGLNNSSTKILSKGDIIISARGTVGAMAMLGKDMAFNQSCYGIQPTKLVDRDYLYYLLFSSIQELKHNSHGGVFDTITRDTFDTIEILLPSLKEQKRIASILSSLDDKIDLLHQENKTLEAMAETLFRKWFIEDAKEEWEEGKLGDEFDFAMGQSPNGESFNNGGDGIPMYQGNADFGFRFPTRRIFTTEPTRIAEEKDTLISVRAPVGAQNMAIEKCCIGRGVAAFRYKKSNSAYYSYTYYKLKSLLNEIKQFNDNGTVFGSISKSDLVNLDIIIPNIDIIIKFQKTVKPIDDKIINNDREIRNLVTLRDSLLSKLMLYNL